MNFCLNHNFYFKLETGFTHRLVLSILLTPDVDSLNTQCSITDTVDHSSHPHESNDSRIMQIGVWMVKIPSEYSRNTKRVRYVISEKFQGAIDNFSGPKSNNIIHQGLKLKFTFIKRVRSLTGLGRVCLKPKNPLSISLFLLSPTSSQ